MSLFIVIPISPFLNRFNPSSYCSFLLIRQSQLALEHEHPSRYIHHMMWFTSWFPQSYCDHYIIYLNTFHNHSLHLQINLLGPLLWINFVCWVQLYLASYFYYTHGRQNHISMTIQLSFFDKMIPQRFQFSFKCFLFFIFGFTIPTVNTIQWQPIILPMTGFELWISGVECKNYNHCPSQIGALSEIRSTLTLGWKHLQYHWY